jgi:hypothetical protein
MLAVQLVDRPRKPFSAAELAAFAVFPAEEAAPRPAAAPAPAPAAAPDDPRVHLMSVDHKLPGIRREVLQPAIARLSNLQWPAWRYNEGNPFKVKITEATVKALGVPTYFRFVRKAMDLTRMGEKLAQDKYPDVDAWLEDARLMVQNAKDFNRGEQAALLGTYPDPAAVGGVYAMAFDMERVIKELEPELRQQWDAALLREKRAEFALAMHLLQQGQAAGGAGGSG